jgi:putative heme-binding domain-containing protein
VSPKIRDAVVKLAADPSPDVRLQVAIASRKIEGFDALPVLFEIISKETNDPLIPQIVWQNLHPLLDDHGADFVKMVEGANLEKSSRLTAILPRAIERFLGGSKVQAEPAVALLTRLLASEQDAEILKASKKSLEIIAERLRPGAIDASQRSKLIALMTAALASTLGGDPSTPLALDAALVAASWKDPAALKAIAKVLGSPKNPEARRIQAVNALIGAGDSSVLDVLGPSLIDRVSGSIGFRGEILASLGRLDGPKVAEVVLGAYPQLEPELQPKAIELLTQRAAWTRTLIDSVERKSIPTSALNVNQIRKLASSKDRSIADRVKGIWGTVRESRDPAREQVIERMKTFLSTSKGDAQAGSTVFKNLCGQCHKIYGEGQEVGPEITLNGRGSYEQLLSNVFDPSLVIGPAYQATTIATTDGRILTGLVVEESPKRVTLKLQGGKLETIERTAIEESKISSLSLMPEGLESQISPKELADLFAFITLDKPPGDPSAKTLPGTPIGIRK